MDKMKNVKTIQNSKFSKDSKKVINVKVLSKIVIYYKKWKNLKKNEIKMKKIAKKNDKCRTFENVNLNLIYRRHINVFIYR